MSPHRTAQQEPAQDWYTPLSADMQERNAILTSWLNTAADGLERAHARQRVMQEALEATQQCITDFLALYGRGCALIVLDEAVKSLRDDALVQVRAALLDAEHHDPRGVHVPPPLR